MNGLAHVLERSRRERESWRYTDVEKILASPHAAKPLRAANSDDANLLRLTFIDGVYRPEQSRLGDLPKDILGGDAKSGYRLALPEETCLITLPIELFFQGGAADTTRLKIELGASGRLTLIECHEALEGAHVIETDITLGRQAKLVHGKIVRGADAPHIALTRVNIAAGAYYDNFALIKGGRLTRNEIEAKLEGKLAQCALTGAMLLRGRDHADTTTRIFHAAPDCTSREIYKSVVGGQARAVFQGKIVVEQGAQKTDGHQLSRALLLSDQAEMDAKPELEIYADDVKCSHGSTIGDLDADALFYLQSRGLNVTDARALLIEAFVAEIIDEIHAPEWRAICRREMEGWLHEQD